MNRPRQSVLPCFNGGNEVEAKQGEVCEIIVGKRFTVEMGVNESETRQSIHASPVRAQIGNEDRACIPDHHDFDVAAPIDQHADLALEFAGQFGERARKLGTDDAVSWNPSVCELLQPLVLGRLESMRVTNNSNTGSPK